MKYHWRLKAKCLSIIQIINFFSFLSSACLLPLALFLSICTCRHFRILQKRGTSVLRKYSSEQLIKIATLGKSIVGIVLAVTSYFGCGALHYTIFLIFLFFRRPGFYFFYCTCAFVSAVPAYRGQCFGTNGRYTNEHCRKTLLFSGNKKSARHFSQQYQFANEL